MGRVIIFPTDTVYGIGTKIFDTEGIKRIYAIKHRPLDKPLACLCASIEQIEEIAEVTKEARKLIKSFLPGPLTLILNSKKEVEERIGYKTIGVRIPNSSLALDLLKDNGPMLTTSVNDSGEVPFNEYDEIYDKYHGLVDMIYPSNLPSSNIASTVVMLRDDYFKILREGQISAADILRVVNE